tara:strand:- start:14894 stop:15160 length:267 start_codon:yes stop_codon:yes gene_type:complete
MAPRPPHLRKSFPPIKEKLQYGMKVAKAASTLAPTAKPELGAVKRAKVWERESGQWMTMGACAIILHGIGQTMAVQEALPGREAASSM